MVPGVAWCRESDTGTAIRHMRHGQGAGADAALIVAPYYNRPTREGLLAHFRALAEASDLPMVVYNVPARTVTDIGAETMCKLAELPSVVAVKDASGDQIGRASCREGVCQYV